MIFDKKTVFFNFLLACLAAFFFKSNKRQYELPVNRFVHAQHYSSQFINSTWLQSTESG